MVAGLAAAVRQGSAVLLLPLVLLLLLLQGQLLQQPLLTLTPR
jgi:hypothetical protein